MSWLLGELPFWRSPLHSLGSLSPHPLTEIDATQISAVCWGDVFKRWEETLDKFRPISETDQEKTVGLLRVFHKHLPEDGKLVLMKDVITIGPDDDKLRELAQHLRNAVLKPMRLTSGKQPKTPPVKPLRLDSIWYAYEQQYAVKQECLRRDGYQCAYTNWPDLESVQDGLVSVGPDNDGRLVACSKCARILPFALGELGDNDQEDTATGRHNKRVIWSTLQRYFPSFVKDKAETLKMVNRVENGLTLDRPLSHYFETFDVVFRPTEQVRGFVLMRIPSCHKASIVNAHLFTRQTYTILSGCHPSGATQKDASLATMKQ
ncbi:hypothetical protein K456DRAFT_42246 [Colletotrichum gloeosporioides 23]|nr:hypothetical protein K456DRAFT_42246 [Colletotrichum gloeosporioides 23]